jgi:predicted glycogen debranching enzyme
MRLPSINLDRSTLANFESAVKKEWLVTNGLGGYASSTVVGLNTRKYHGLLVAAIHPPQDRRVFLEKLDEDLVSGGKTYRLGTNEFSNTFFPTGHEFLEQCLINPFPTYTYTADKTTVRKTIFMTYQKNCTIALYNVSNKTRNNVKMRIFPLVNWRNFHSVTRRSQVSSPEQKVQANQVKLSLYGPKATLLLRSTEGQYHTNGTWTENLYLREEAARGESCFDDCYQPGYFEIDLEGQTSKDVAITAMADEDDLQAEKTVSSIPSTISGITSLHEKETERYQKLLDDFYVLHETARPSNWLNWLILAAHSFIVRDFLDREKSIIAGYHWFGVWGRDTFVSIPGLMFLTGRFKEAREIFLTFVRHMKNGLIPNFIPEDSDSCVYNTVDATLWFSNAVLQYLKYTGDFAFVRKHLWETLKQIVDSHVKGTLFSIHVDDDGLLSHGPQLTWMDSSVCGKPFSPRAGKAVEVQALWYNMLRTMQLLAVEFGEKQEADKLESRAEKTCKTFVRKFWNSQKGCLYDVIEENGPDVSIRPNQILAISLDFPILDADRNEKVARVVQEELLTPYGLRTLSKKDPRYIGVYGGDRSTRDKAYHYGTVWPWLLGSFTTAFLKIQDHVETQREFAFRNFLSPLFTTHVFEAGLGTVSEIFDGDSPHVSRGCISQAWSVAEPLRAYFEDVLLIRPVHEREVLKKSI